MRGAFAVLLVVGRAVEGELTGAEAHLVGAVAHDLEGDLLGVLQAVDVGDLVAVVGRDRDLDDALAGLDQLQDDLGVEVEAVAVALEGQPSQRLDRVRPVARVPLGQPDAGHGVLDRGQDAVADELVQRHAATARRAGVEHAGAEHGVGLAGEQRGDHLGEQLGGVLAVAVQQHDDVEVRVDRGAVAPLLVAAVAKVLLVAGHLDGQIGIELLVADGDQVRLVLAVVVADDHAGDRRAEVVRDAVQHLGQRRRCVVRHDKDADSLGSHTFPPSSMERGYSASTIRT